MNFKREYQGLRILSLAECAKKVGLLKAQGKSVVLTNGCFDILHRGHIEYLRQSAALGDALVVAINDDASVNSLKGPGRPVNGQNDRAELVASLRFVDAVTVFPGPRLTKEILTLAPDVYTKGGDYTLETLDVEEKEALLEIDAQIKILPFVSGYSSSRLANLPKSPEVNSVTPANFSNARGELQTALAKSEQLDAAVIEAECLLLDCLRGGRSVFTCGNGGSAACAAHLTEELIGKFRSKRRAMPSICLNADVTALTCIANDFGYEKVFSRSIEALGKPGDLLIAFSTSGSSENIVSVLKTARQMQINTLLLTGGDGGSAQSIADKSIVMPTSSSARVQELHTLILHSWLERIDQEFA